MLREHARFPLLYFTRTAAGSTSSGAVTPPGRLRDLQGYLARKKLPHPLGLP